MSNIKLLASDTAIYGFGLFLKVIAIFLLPFTQELLAREYGILDSLATLDILFH